jgi:hypothetical protein
MNRPFRKQVKIVKALKMGESDQHSGRSRYRDSRPGHFTIKGSFIKLPDLPGTSSGDRRE